MVLGSVGRDYCRKKKEKKEKKVLEFLIQIFV